MFTISADFKCQGVMNMVTRHVGGVFSGVFSSFGLFPITAPTSFTEGLQVTSVPVPPWVGVNPQNALWPPSAFQDEGDRQRVVSSQLLWQIPDITQPTTIYGLMLATSYSPANLVNGIENWDTPFTMLSPDDALLLVISIGFENGELVVRSELL